MKSFFSVLFYGTLIALGGAFCEMWSLPYLGDLPTYRTVWKDLEESMDSKSKGKRDGSYLAPFANNPNAESSRRAQGMRDAKKQLGGR